MFEAAGAGACQITDAWLGIDEFFEPGTEILVAQDAGEVARTVSQVLFDDLAFDGMAHIAFVRSTIAHARVTGIDVAEAREAPGVLGVFTAADLDIEPLPPGSPMFNAASAAFIWTVDDGAEGRGWVVYYHDGFASQESHDFNAYVRAVRSH